MNLLFHRWAAIASYLPQRTDNDIKNYWNTYLKKKLNKLETGLSAAHSREGFSSTTSQSMSRGQWERRLQTDIHMAKQALSEALSPDKPPTTLSDFESSNSPVSCNKPPQGSSSYASSTENIARLLKGWMRNPAKPARKSSATATATTTQNNSLRKICAGNESASSEGTQSAANYNSGMEMCEAALESLFGFESFESSNSDLSGSVSPDASLFQDESKPDTPNVDQLPLSLLEKWLFDESAISTTQGKEQQLISNYNDMTLVQNADFFSS